MADLLCLETFEIDLKKGHEELYRFEVNVEELPEDPFLVKPTNNGSSRKIIDSRGLSFDKSVDSIMPHIDGYRFCWHIC